MSAHLAATLALYGIGLAGYALVLAVSGRSRPPSLLLGMGLLEAGAVVQAVLDGVALLGGHRPAERATHLGYLAASVVLLPLVLSATAPQEPRSRWDNAVAGVGCLGTAVVALRLRVTWASA